jgi:hypothetical protein
LSPIEDTTVIPKVDGWIYMGGGRHLSTFGSVWIDVPFQVVSTGI